MEVVALEDLHECMSAASAAMKVVTSPPHTAPNPMPPRAMFTAARDGRLGRDRFGLGGFEGVAGDDPAVRQHDARHGRDGARLHGHERRHGVRYTGSKLDPTEAEL